jgi:hypothetical protein
VGVGDFKAGTVRDVDEETAKRLRAIGAVSDRLAAGDVQTSAPESEPVTSEDVEAEPEGARPTSRTRKLRRGKTSAGGGV